MPDGRLERTRRAYESGCVCERAIAHPEEIPPGVAVTCPNHPARTVRRGPVCDT